jgi:nicotinamide-nucleotide adenylyltransferase
MTHHSRLWQDGNVSSSTSAHTTYHRIGMVARWRPVHLGQAAVLEAMGRAAEQCLIGIGSANRYDLRNPFTLGETESMLHLVTGDQPSFRIIPIPDLDDGPGWRQMVYELFGDLDLFLTDNRYVWSLMTGLYPLARPVTLVPPAHRVEVSGTMVRSAMAGGDGWQELVPEKVAAYLVSSRLDKRFRREFGLQTLALAAADSPSPYVPGELDDSLMANNPEGRRDVLMGR